MARPVLMFDAGSMGPEPRCKFVCDTTGAGNAVGLLLAATAILAGVMGIHFAIGRRITMPLTAGAATVRMEDHGVLSHDEAVLQEARATVTAFGNALAAAATNLPPGSHVHPSRGAIDGYARATRAISMLDGVVVTSEKELRLVHQTRQLLLAEVQCFRAMAGLEDRARNSADNLRRMLAQRLLVLGAGTPTPASILQAFVAARTEAKAYAEQAENEFSITHGDDAHERHVALVRFADELRVQQLLLGWAYSSS